MAEVPLQEGTLVELLSFCFLVPQQPAAIVPGVGEREERARAQI